MNWLFSKNGKGARANAIYQSLIMTAEVNGLSPRKYFEWLLTQIKALEAPTAEDFARYLPWSDEAQEKCKISSICTEKYQHYFKKRSLNTIQFEKIIAYQAIWRTPTILSYAYLSTIVIIVIFGVISHIPLAILDLSLKYRYIKKHRNKL